MSTGPESEFDLDKLFLPAWAQEPAAAKYAKYEVEPEDRFERRPERRGQRGPRPERRPGPRREDSRPPGAGRRPGPSQAGQRRGGPDDRAPAWRREPPERREPPPPLPDLAVSLLPDEKGVESLARQIKMTGRAYPLFDIARMILQKPERHSVAFSIKKNAEGQPLQPLVVCALDDTLWLSEDEAVAHVIKRHFGTFYQADRTATEPPKGKYTFVAQCGLSGVILGPPNYHDYQNQLRKLHTERFSRMPFEAFKARVRIVRDEEVVKKWVDDQSWRTEYICLNLPEPLRLGNLEAVEAHFRQTHKDNIIKRVEAHTLSGVAARALRSPDLARLVRVVTEDQRRFPLQLATALSQQFATHGLQFFKVNKAITHVCVARPHYLDLAATPVSDGVRLIVEFINSHPKCTRRELVETLAPSPAHPPAPPTPAPDQAPPAPPSTGPTPEQTAVIADLHWLIHQGHVIEFADGMLETAKRPLPKPPRPAAKPSAPTPEPAAAAAAPVAGTEAQPEPAPGAELAESQIPGPTALPQAPASPEGSTAAELQTLPEVPASPEAPAPQSVLNPAAEPPPNAVPVDSPAASVESPS